MNHSKNNNIDVLDDNSADACEYCNFIANRLIQKGEELLIDYEKYDEL